MCCGVLQLTAAHAFHTRSGCGHSRYSTRSDGYRRTGIQTHTRRISRVDPCRPWPKPAGALSTSGAGVRPDPSSSVWCKLNGTKLCFALRRTRKLMCETGVGRRALPTTLTQAAVSAGSKAAHLHGDTVCRRQTILIYRTACIHPGDSNERSGNSTLQHRERLLWCHRRLIGARERRPRFLPALLRAPHPGCNFIAHSCLTCARVCGNLRGAVG